jgi:hypothetical protein
MIDDHATEAAPETEEQACMAFQQTLSLFLSRAGQDSDYLARVWRLKKRTVREYLTEPGHGTEALLGRATSMDRAKLLKAVRVKPTITEVNDLLLAGGYVPLSERLASDKAIIDALRRAAGRAVGTCIAFTGRQHGVGADWDHLIAAEEERIGPRLMILNYQPTVAVPDEVNEAILGRLTPTEREAWSALREARTRTFEAALRQHRVRHLYRIDPIERWVRWLEVEGRAPVYAVQIRPTEAAAYVRAVAALLARRNFEAGLLEEAGGFDYEIIGERPNRVILVDSEAGRSPAAGDRPTRDDMYLDGLRIEGEATIDLFQDSWEAAWARAFKNPADVIEKLEAWAARLDAVAA